MIDEKQHPAWGEFDPEQATDKDLKDVAEVIERYLDHLEHCMVFPEEMSKKDRERIERGCERTRILIKKLKKGKRGIFKSMD